MPSSTAKDKFERACVEHYAKRTERRGQERLVEKIHAELERKDTEVKATRDATKKHKHKYEDMKAQNAAYEDMEEQKRMFRTTFKLFKARKDDYTTLLTERDAMQTKLRELEAEEEVCKCAAEASVTPDMVNESELEAFDLEIDLEILMSDVARTARQAARNRCCVLRLAAMEQRQYGLLSQTSTHPRAPGTGSLMQPVSPARTPTPSPTPSQAAGTAALKRYIQSSCPEPEPEPEPETEPKPEPETDPKPEPVICSICHDECKDKPISCGHHFHADCILGWTMRGKKECPYCRQKIIPTSFTQHLS